MPEIIRTDIDTTIYTSNKCYGGEGKLGLAHMFENCRGDVGATITQLTAYTNSWEMLCLHVKFSDGKYYKYGEESGSKHHQQFTFKEGETVTELIMYDSHKKSSGDGYYHSGGFNFNTNLSRYFDVKPSKHPKHSYKIQDVGSGLLCGVFGSSDNKAVDNLGFAILRPVESAFLVDVTYPNLEKMPVTTPATMINSLDYKNTTSVPQTIELDGSTAMTTTRKWSKTTSMEVQMSTMAKCGVPGVAEVKNTLQWSVGQTSTMERSTSKKTSTSYSFPIVCDAHKETTSQAIIYEDQLSIEYKGTMKYYLDNGAVLSYPVSGVYDGLSTRGVDVETQEHDIN